jgi:predicted aspartyl protease
MAWLARISGACAMLLTSATLSLPAQDTLHSTPMEVTHDKPYVMVMLNGKGPFRFIIDTGTGGQALVTPELAGQLDLPLAGQARLTDPSGQGEQRAQIVLIQSLQVAGVEFTGIKAIQHTLSSEDGSCLGLLGFTLFRDYLLTLDYPNRRMTLASGALKPDNESSVLPFRMPDGVPTTTLRIDGLRIEAQLDSGGSGLSLPEQLVPRLKLASGPVVFGNGQSLSTRFQIKAAKLASDVHLGRYAFARPFVEINPAFPLASLGSSPMQNFVFTFDQKNLLVRFYANQKVLHLATPSTTIRMQNAPAQKPPDLSLVPVG